MKQWLPLAVLLLFCSCTSQPTPQPPPESTPLPIQVVTVVPIPTLLPTVTVPIPTVPPPTPTPAPTATRGAAGAQVANRIAAPAPLAPQSPTLLKNGNDIKFTFASVGKLEPNQCYLLHVELVVPNLPEGNRGDDFLDTANCGDPGPAGKALSFVLYRGRFTNSPNYGTMLAQIDALAPEARKLKMTWTVQVVQNNGRSADGVHYNTLALSPVSPVMEFPFEP